MFGGTRQGHAEHGNDGAHGRASQSAGQPLWPGVCRGMCPALEIDLHLDRLAAGH